MSERRFIRRTWRQTSEKICLANAIPPGFRIVLLDEDGRVKRDDLMVRSGDFASEPVGFSVEHFLEMAIKNSVKDVDRLDYASIELRNHRDEPVDPDLTLRRVRDMVGTGDRHSKAWEDKDDLVPDLEGEIEEALAIFDEDFRLLLDPQTDILLKALIQYTIHKFEIDALDHVIDFYQVEIERLRIEKG